MPITLRYCIFDFLIDFRCRGRQASIAVAADFIDYFVADDFDFRFFAFGR